MSFRVLHHNNCFDGACSAAVFTKLHRECLGGAAGYEYVGLSHGPAGGLSESIFGTGENAIVDFKYSPSPRLTWWFDHHQSAFLTQADRDHFEHDPEGQASERQFFDEDAISCTGFIARVGVAKFGFDVSGLTELLHWADIVDGARYESAQAAVAMEAPAMKLATVIENGESTGFIPRVIPLLTEIPLEEIIAQPFIAERIQPLLDRHFAMVDLVRERAELKDGTIYFDLTDRSIEGLSKFIPYFLFPDATYTVAVTRSSFRTKISVGTNPWTTAPTAQLANIAEICERFGGGGHARVGAISYGVDEQASTLAVAAEVLRELRSASTRN
jgi:hypothetical protein